VRFRNDSDLDLRLYWIGFDGALHHGYALKPGEDHLENTTRGHAFLFAVDEGETDSEEEREGCASCLFRWRRTARPGGREGIDPKRVVGAYRPGTSPPGAIVVTISRREVSPRVRRSGKWRVADSWGALEWRVAAERIAGDGPLDASGKEYSREILGGWPVRCESCWDERDDPEEGRELREKMELDVSSASRLLPAHARDRLRESTCIWINKSQRYGPASAPIEGHGMCFHVSEEWLVRNGMSAEKARHVELYDAGEYPRDAQLWGPGGIILHELSHAWHNKHVPDGYDNYEVEKCYALAMEEGLYDCVPVHGPQGPRCRAYACDNAYEYFAELSTAFLGGTGGEEFNKWFPFNREQLRMHDPRAFRMLCKLWNVSY